MTGYKRLFSVQEIFRIPGRGVILSPGPLFSLFGHEKKTAPRIIHHLVVIKRPDETTLEAEADFYIPFLHPWEAMESFLEYGCYECVLKGVEKSDIPKGSEIWAKL